MINYERDMHIWKRVWKFGMTVVNKIIELELEVTPSPIFQFSTNNLIHFQ